MKYLIIFMLILSGCSKLYTPKYKKGDCFVKFRTDLESWESQDCKIYDVKQVIEIGKNNYRVLLTYGLQDYNGNYELVEDKFSFSLADDENYYKRSNCPVQIFGN